jgi:hypothetical protein
MALLTKNIPQRDGIRYRFRNSQRAVREHFGQFLTNLSSLRNAREITLHIGHENWHANPAESLGHGLQRHGFASAGRAGDHAVAVGFVGAQEAFDIFVLGNEDRVGHDESLKVQCSD